MPMKQMVLGVPSMDMHIGFLEKMHSRLDPPLSSLLIPHSTELTFRLVNHGVILQVLMFVELRNLLEGQSISGA